MRAVVEKEVKHTVEDAESLHTDGLGCTSNANGSVRGLAYIQVQDHIFPGV